MTDEDWSEFEFAVKSAIAASLLFVVIALVAVVAIISYLRS